MWPSPTTFPCSANSTGLPAAIAHAGGSHILCNHTPEDAYPRPNGISRQVLIELGRWTLVRLGVLASESTAGLLMAEPGPQGKHTAWVYLSNVNIWGCTFQTLGNSCLIQGHGLLQYFYATHSFKRNAPTFLINLPQKGNSSQTPSPLCNHTMIFWFAFKKKKAASHSILEIFLCVTSKHQRFFSYYFKKKSIN